VAAAPLTFTALSSKSSLYPELLASSSNTREKVKAQSGDSRGWGQAGCLDKENGMREPLGPFAEPAATLLS